MSTTVWKYWASRGSKSTLYDPMLNTQNNNAIKNLQKQLLDVNPLIGYAHVIPSDNTIEMVETKFQANGSPFAYQLSPVEFNFQVVISLSSVESLLLTNSFS